MSWLLTAGGAVLDLARSARQIGAGQAAEPRRTAPSKCKRLPFRVPCGIPSIPPALAATGQFQYLGLSARARLPRGDRKYRGDPAADRGSLERMEARSLARRRLGGGRPSKAMSPRCRSASRAARSRSSPGTDPRGPPSSTKSLNGDPGASSCATPAARPKGPPMLDALPPESAESVAWGYRWTRPPM